MRSWRMWMFHTKKGFYTTGFYRVQHWDCAVELSVMTVLHVHWHTWGVGCRCCSVVFHFMKLDGQIKGAAILVAILIICWTVSGFWSLCFICSILMILLDIGWFVCFNLIAFPLRFVGYNYFKLSIGCIHVGLRTVVSTLRMYSIDTGGKMK